MRKPKTPEAGSPASLRLLRLPEVQKKTGLGHDSVYRLARRGQFPRPIKIGLHASAWLESEVDAFIVGRIAERDAAAAAEAVRADDGAAG